MAEAKHVDFNALPREVRERLIACMQHQSYPYPLISHVPSPGAAIAGWIFLALVGAVIVLGALFSGFGRDLQSPGMLALYALGIGLGVLSILFLVRRVMLGSALPYKPGRFLFPMDFVDAQERMLRVIPMSSMVDFRGVHQHTNGVYTGTTLTFTFEGGVNESFVIQGKERAEEVLRQLGDSRRRIGEAVGSRDIDTLLRMDPFFEVRMKDLWNMQAPRDEDAQQPAAKHVGGLFAKGAIWGVSGAAAAVLAVPMWHMRNVASDEAMFSSAKRSDTEWEFKHYVDHGKRHVDEVKEDLLPRAALREAKQKGTVSALRAFMRSYPGSVVDKEAHDEEHALFVKTLEEFRDQASKEDARLLPFMEKLLAYLEKNDTARVEARFESPTNEALTQVDTLLAKLGNEPGDSRRMVPVAPYFAEKVSVARESEIVRGLEKGFGAVFPADVMAIKHGPRIGPDGKPLAVQPEPQKPSLSDLDPSDPDYLSKLREASSLGDLEGAGDASDAKIPAPTLDIKYKVGWAGDFFTEEKGDRKFVGIVVNFHVAMKIPGESDTLEFDMAVQPPDHFTVNYSNPMYGIGGGPSEGQVYNVMAARAFDELGIKMRKVFFRPGSKAYGPIEPNDVPPLPGLDDLDPDALDPDALDKPNTAGGKIPPSGPGTRKPTKL